MGAWGYGAFDNDSAWDWMDSITTPMIGTISGALSGVNHKNHSGYWEAVAAAALLVEYSGTRPLDLAYDAQRHGLYEDAVIIISMIRDNADYIATWDDPKKAKNALAYLVIALNRKWRDIRRRMTRQKARMIVRVGSYKRKPKARKRRAGGNA